MKLRDDLHNMIFGVIFINHIILIFDKYNLIENLSKMIILILEMLAIII